MTDTDDERSVKCFGAREAAGREVTLVFDRDLSRDEISMIVCAVAAICHRFKMDHVD